MAKGQLTEKATHLATEEAKKTSTETATNVAETEEKPEKEKETEKTQEDRPSAKPLGRQRRNAVSRKDAPKPVAKSAAKWTPAKKPSKKTEDMSKLDMGSERLNAAKTPDELAEKKADAARNKYIYIMNWARKVQASEKKHLYIDQLEMMDNYIDTLDGAYAVPSGPVIGGSAKQVQAMQMTKLYSFQARTELNKASKSMDRVKQAKSSFRADITSNPVILQMLLHVNKVNSETKAKALTKVINEAGGKSLSEEEIQKRTWAVMNDPQKGVEIGNLTKAPTQKEQDDKHAKKFFEMLLEMYNNVMGMFGDVKDTFTGASDNFDKYADGAWRHCNFEAPESTDYLSAFGALISMVVKIVVAAKGFKEAKENADVSDKQEKLGTRKENIFNALDAISSIWDVVSNFTGAIPFLNPVIGILQNSITITKAVIDIGDAHEHSDQAHGSMDKLKKRMQEKQKKYSGLKEEEFFRLDKMDDASIRHKKDQLMADALNTVHGSKRSTDDNDISKDGKSHHIRNFFDTLIHRKDKEVWDKGNGDVTERMQDSMEAMRKAHRERMAKPEETSPGEERIYKVKMHRLEAIQLLQDYEIQRAAVHRNHVKIGQAGFDLGTAIGKAIMNGVELLGDIGIAAGGMGGGIFVGAKAGKAAIGIAETAKYLGGKANASFERHSQRGKNKSFHRNEMATSLCERMAAFGSNYTLDGAYDDLVSGNRIKDSVADRQIIHMQREFDFLKSVRQSTDMKVSSIINAESRAAIIDSLSSVFSQDGN